MKTITIQAPKHLPGAITYARNYRSKPCEPWVLVCVRSVETGWRKDGTVNHAYTCVRINSSDPEDYYRTTRQKFGIVFLYVGDDKIDSKAL